MNDNGDIEYQADFPNDFILVAARIVGWIMETRPKDFGLETTLSFALMKGLATALHDPAWAKAVIEELSEDSGVPGALEALMGSAIKTVEMFPMPKVSRAARRRRQRQKRRRSA